MNADELNKVIENLRRCDQNYEESVSIYTFENAIEAIQQLRKQRDEARREVCNWSVGVGHKATSQAVAEERGWDCYKETT